MSDLRPRDQPRPAGPWGGPQPSPGWYADPEGAAWTLRWWDGSRWTAAVHLLGPPPPPGWSPAAGGAGPPLPGNGPWGPAPSSYRTDAADQARVIPARAAWWALLGLAVGEVVAGILVAIAAAVTGSSTGAGVTLIGEIGIWGGMLGACLLVSRKYGTASLRRDFLLRFRPVDLAWGPLATVAGLVVTALVSQAFTGTRLAGSNTQIISGSGHTTVGAVLITLVVSAGAPLFEELFFRGLVRTALAARLGPLGAVAAQAVLFGLAHLNPVTGLGNVEVVVVIAAFGAVLGMVAHLTGRLAPGMIGHGLYNLLVTVVLLTG